MEPKTHCPQGHEYTEENTYVWKNARMCKTCSRERMRDRRRAVGIGKGGWNATSTHCPKSHEYTEENTYLYGGSKKCRICQRERSVTGVGTGGHNAAKTHCPHGHEYTPENTITVKVPTTTGVARQCKTCYRISHWKTKVRQTYGITLKYWEEMLIQQNGRCAICLAPFLAGICIDHDHKCCAGTKACGKCVRALLCHDCNRGLGCFRDNPVDLRAASEYLAGFMPASFDEADYSAYYLPYEDD